ncbi:MAG: aminodeoxychorismate synthase component I [Gammaproteobacteria bacterium]|nr:aminodeoxychorismate synthase component I [Gammaproteobacteria bacterium]
MSYRQETLNHVIDLAAIQYRNIERYPFLLDSVAKESQQGRYSLLFAFVQESIECPDATKAQMFFDELGSRWQSLAQPATESLLPFTGGWFVYLGYEAVSGIEPSLDNPAFRYDFPVAFASRCPAGIIVDHEMKQTHCICEDDYQNLMDTMLADIQAVAEQGLGQVPPVTVSPDEAAAQDYTDSVSSILEYIRSGDVFQVNLSRAWNVSLDKQVHPSVLYHHLSNSNPAPFACLVHHPKGNIISSSPERLVRVADGRVETRPIAGTRPRTNDAQDRHWLNELRTDHKEQAEHIMLIDLERNDLGRVCEPGTIEVDELMALESYAHVHHIVSNISGRLRDGMTPINVLKAVFPGGTITGCPKVRCMEIIAELEAEGRGPYTGSAGYINHDGSMDFNILIRTIFQQDQTLHFRAGAGIVADSLPNRELEETRHKAKGLLLSLGAA